MENYTDRVKDWHPTTNGNLTSYVVTLKVTERPGGNATEDMNGKQLRTIGARNQVTRNFIKNEDIQSERIDNAIAYQRYFGFPPPDPRNNTFLTVNKKLHSSKK